MGFFGFLGEVISAIGASSEDLERQQIKKDVIKYLEKGERRTIIRMACTRASILDSDQEGYKAYKRRVSDTTIEVLKDRKEFGLLEEIEKEIQKMPPYMQAKF